MAEELNLFPYQLKAPTHRGRLTAFATAVLRRNLDTPVGEWCIRAEGVAPRRLYLDPVVI